MGANTSVSAGKRVVGEVRNEVMRSKAQFSVFDGRLECGRVTEAAGQSFIPIFDQDGHLIADVWLLHDDGSNNPADGVAYARMFAAAPDMYQLLKILYEKTMADDDDILNELCGIGDVLAKAEGREVR